MDPQTPLLAVVVATADRAHLLARVALPSIMSQSKAPQLVLVVDDSSQEQGFQQTNRAIRRIGQSTGDIALLRNRRTKGAAGAWNSAIDHLLRSGADPNDVYVAFLDDDDEWLAHHLAECMALVAKDDLDVIAAPLERIEDGADPKPMRPPERLVASAFLVGNPGVQGSNLVCRLRVLLEAGLFDEWLPSCTDRDLCIRLADLPGIRYGTTSLLSVRHFASASRPRLSTPGSPAKTLGLDRFFAKYRDRMSPSEQAAFRKRARERFGWREKPAIAAAALASPSRSRNAPASAAALPHLVVGFVAEAEHLGRTQGLLAQLGERTSDSGLSGLDVVVLENGSGATPNVRLAELVAGARRKGLRVHLVDRVRYLRDAEMGLVATVGSSDQKLLIAPARTALQSYLYAFAKRVPGAVVWIVDDDMRLDPLVAGKDGAARRQPIDMPKLLCELVRLRNERQVDVAVGGCTGAPPVPNAATVRVQFVDLTASLTWLRSLAPERKLPERRGANAALRAERRDYYYDLSSKETDRLETPFLLEPASRSETVGGAFLRLSRDVARILAGVQVFRPLVAEPGGDLLQGDGLLRGGNTFVLDIEALRDVPNPSLLVEGRPTRRSDMVWALLQRQCFARRVEGIASALHHDRSDAAASRLDIDRLIDDFRGHALVAALDEVPAYRVDGRRLTPEPDRLNAIFDCVQKHLDDRIAAFRLSFHRIRGLARVLRRLMADQAAWWWEDPYREAAAEVLAFADQIAGLYNLAELDRIDRKATALDRSTVQTILERLPKEIEDHRSRLEDTAPLFPEFEAERIANAKAAVARLMGAAPPLKVLGCGAEGVALTDGKHVFKLFDYWKSWQTKETRAFLRYCVGAWPDAQRLYPILDFREHGHECLLVYRYEPSEPYVGGDGPGMVELMVECRRFGVVCRNIHPDNLRLVDGQVRFIDYGSDIRPLRDEEEYLATCRRAWLSWRWPQHPRLKEIMRESLTNSALPELKGFDIFHEAVQRLTGERPPPEDIAFRLAGSAETVLDYGCGKGRLAKRLADLGGSVVGYDPLTHYQSHWDAMSVDAGNLWFTRRRDRALAAGPFALAICRRVLCTVDDEEMAFILDDLRDAVRDDGRVVLTLCNPDATFRGPSLEADRDVPAGVGPDDCFEWHKHIRASGRTRKDVHRPERFVLAAIARAGFEVRGRLEEPTIDLNCFERIADHIAYDLWPVPRPPGQRP